MVEKRCIVCGIKRDGLPVREDNVIMAIRWFKRNVTKNEKGYNLVVCRDCYKKYEKSKHTYDRRRILYTSLGVIVAVLWIIVGGIRIDTVITAIVFIGIMYLLSLISYTPSLILDVNHKVRKRGASSREGMR